MNNPSSKLEARAKQMAEELREPVEDVLKKLTAAQERLRSPADLDFPPSRDETADYARTWKTRPTEAA